MDRGPGPGRGRDSSYGQGRYGQGGHPGSGANPPHLLQQPFLQPLLQQVQHQVQKQLQQQQPQQQPQQQGFVPNPGYSWGVGPAMPSDAWARNMSGQQAGGGYSQGPFAAHDRQPMYPPAQQSYSQLPPQQHGHMPDTVALHSPRGFSPRGSMDGNLPPAPNQQWNRYPASEVYPDRVSQDGSRVMGVVQPHYMPQQQPQPQWGPVVVLPPPNYSAGIGIHEQPPLPQSSPAPPLSAPQPPWHQPLQPAPPASPAPTPPQPSPQPAPPHLPSEQCTVLNSATTEPPAAAPTEYDPAAPSVSTASPPHPAEAPVPLSRKPTAPVPLSRKPTAKPTVLAGNRPIHNFKVGLKKKPVARKQVPAAGRAAGSPAPASGVRRGVHLGRQACARGLHRVCVCVCEGLQYHMCVQLAVQPLPKHPSANSSHAAVFHF